MVSRGLNEQCKVLPPEKQNSHDWLFASSQEFSRFPTLHCDLNTIQLHALASSYVVDNSSVLSANAQPFKTGETRDAKLNPQPPTISPALAEKRAKQNESARRSRLKKLKVLQDFEKQLNELKTVNTALEVRVKILEEEKMMLRSLLDH